MTEQNVATGQETIEALLRRSQRKVQAVPIRRTFVQGGSLRHPEPGPLAGLVRRHDERALDTYLIVHAVASAEPWTVTEAASLWARTLDLISGESSEAAVSKIWKRLEGDGLIRRQRSGRRAEVTLLREDGSGSKYRHPGGSREAYFKLPYEYWTGGDHWYRTLRLAEKALLLISLSLKDGFVLPLAKAPLWYGISTETARKGLKGLQENRLLRFRKVYKKAPLAPLGVTEELQYTLLSPFRSQPPRRAHLRAVND